jgi:hypothetical protein
MSVSLLDKNLFVLITSFIFRAASASSYENPPRATQYQSTKRFDNLQADVNQVSQIYFLKEIRLNLK